MIWDDIQRLIVEDTWSMNSPNDEVFNAACVLSQDQKSALLDTAFTALRAAGVRFMPSEATEKMLKQGAHKLREFTESRGPYPRTNSMYTAMLAAGEIKPEDGK